ncbi:MAG: 3-methyl-2-oxobutanoate hydroxymethyltransferase, partial [Candidatus Aminicenantes bacterium]|nr:3-methyl-2-oxobutanoate hydroxymethyltransferase [Candidatus Aminicenantes bacterium]
MEDLRGDKITIPSLQARKASGPKIVCLTAYDYPTAKILDQGGVDLILVGDSLGMVVLGYENTVPVTMDEMIHHTRAVSRAVRRALVVGDMPYFSFHLTADETIRNAARFLKEGGAAAVKIEGASKKRLKLV